MTDLVLPDHARETIEAIDRRLAELESERRELLAGRTTVLKLFQIDRDPGASLQARAAVDMTGCPLSIEEMVIIHDRHRIIFEMATRDPQGRVHVPKAARWLHGSGVVPTVPANMAKALARRMRKDPNWISEGEGWFQLRDHNGMDPSEDQ